MRLFTVKRLATGEITGEGIEFTSGRVVYSPCEDGLSRIYEWEDINDFQRHVSISPGHFVTWTEEMRIDSADAGRRISGQ